MPINPVDYGDPAVLVPWQSMNIPIAIQNELNRRKINRSFNYVSGEKGQWDEDTGDWSTYRGPMTPWIRFCSNGAGLQYETDKN